MSTVAITKRTRASGETYVVRYRLGGRDTPLVHIGSFKTRKEARVRRDFVAAALAAGRDPLEVLVRRRGVPKQGSGSLERAYTFLRGAQQEADRALPSLGRRERAYVRDVLDDLYRASDVLFKALKKDLAA